MKVRRATEDDLPAVVALQLEARAELARLAVTAQGQRLGKTVAAEELRAELSFMLGSENSILLLAEENGEALGFCLGYIEEAPDDLVESPFMTLMYLAVAESARRRGLARELLRQMEDRARKLGLSAVDILVWESNRAAIELYQSEGYAALELRFVKKL